MQNQKEVFILRQDKILKRVAIDPEFNVYRFNAFRYVVKELLPNARNPMLFMIDVNNLYALNERLGKEKANVYLRQLITDIRKTVASKVKNYKIAKLGDEIYIYAENCDENKALIIEEKISRLITNCLTVSAGHSKFTDNIFGTALDVAEADMQAHKKKYKELVLNEVYGNNLPELLKYLITERFSRSRFSLKEMSKEQVICLREGLKNAMRDFLDRGNREESKSPPPSDEVKKMVEMYTKYIEKCKQKSMKKYGRVDENYLLAQLLSGDVEPECVSDAYFQEIMMEEKGEQAFLGKEIILMRISGIKRINDKYGHDVCDKRVRALARRLKEVLSENGIIRTTPIIIRGAKEIYTFARPSEKFGKAMQEINELNEFTEELLIHASNDMLPFEKEPGAEVKEIVNNNLYKLMTEENHTKYDSKTKNSYHLRHFVTALEKSFFNNPIVQTVVRENEELKNKFIMMAVEHIAKSLDERLKEIEESKNFFSK